MTENKEKKAKKKLSKKQKMIIGILLVTLLGGASWILLQNPQIFEVKPKDDKATTMYSDKLISYVFYKTDYNLDVTADQVYMGLDRNMYYKNGSETLAVTADDYIQYGSAVQFFWNYFQTVIAGDTETYNTYFSDNYYETNTVHERFAPQMLYDMLIEKLSETPNNNQTVTHKYNVSYKIHRNDGTFRNDIDSDSSKVLYFELLEDPSGEIKIDRITYYTNRKGK